MHEHLGVGGGLGRAGGVAELRVLAAGGVHGGRVVDAHHRPRGAQLGRDVQGRGVADFLSALQHIDPTHVRARGVILSRVAVARIARGELDGAAQMAGDALPLATAQLHSKRALDELADVDQALTAADPSTPAVRDFGVEEEPYRIER